MKKLKTKKHLAIILLATYLSAGQVFADGEFSYTDIEKSFNIKPITLDKTKTEKIIPKTSIPFHLREFNEAEYFTSNIDDTPPKKEISQPTEILANDESPPAENSPPQENFVFKPTETAVNFFSPLEETSEEVCAEEISNNIFSVSEDTYVASSEYNEGDNYEGKVISEIKIYGLNNLKSDVVLSKMNTKTGSIYNTNLLQQDLQNIYNTGYFSDDMTIEPELNEDGKISLVLNLKENILVSNVRVKGNTVFSNSEIAPYLKNIYNKPQNLIEINKSIENITQHYHGKGYILAEVASIDDNEEGGLDFTINEGVIDKILISGNERTKDYVITRNLLTRQGSVYNEDLLKKDLAKVFSTQIFEEVDRNITPSESVEGAYDVTVVVKEKITNSIALGGGIDTGLGAFGSLSLKEENFLGRGQRVSIGGILGSGILLSDASIKNHMNYQVELGFFEPHFLNADNSLMGKLFYKELGSFQVPLAIERRIGANIGVEHKVNGYDNLSTSLIAGVEHINLKEGDRDRISHLYNLHNLDFSQRAKQLTDGFFFNLSPGIKYSSLDNEEIPREGIIAQARFTEAFGVSNFNHTHGRLHGAVTKFFPVFKKSTFSLTAKAGAKIHGDNMPEVMAYRLGGPYTIRGYRMNGVGTGESFLMGSAELATPLPWSDKLKWDFIKKMRLTFFVDAGKVFDPTVTNVLFDRPEHAITAGIGLRVYIPGVGPISVDYGIPITNPGSYGSENGYFTFGTGGMNVYGTGY